MLTGTTLNTIGIMFQICDDKDEMKNAIASILDKKEKVKKPKKISKKQYITKKIKVLKGFEILLDDEQIEHMKSLPNEYAIDRYARSIILGCI